MRILAPVAAAAAVLALAGCNLENPPAPLPPARASVPAGPVYARYAAYVAAHPQPRRRGMEYGVLVQAAGQGYVCLSGYCHTWSGTVVIPGGRIEHLTSDQGADGMAQLVQPGDMFWFPAGGPVDAPSDDYGTLPARVITAGAVRP